MNETHTSSDPGVPPIAHPPAPKRQAISLVLQTVGVAAVAASVVAAMVLLNRSPVPDARGSDRQPEREAFAQEIATNPLPAETPVAPSRPKKTPGQHRATNLAPAVKPASIVVRPRTGGVPKDEDPVVRMTAADVKHVAQAAESIAATANDSAATTIIGCLETSTAGDEFRLTDTEGTDAPKSRGWRSGFLKKRTVPVALVDAPGGLALKSNVGKRVAVTGLLASRELTVSTLRVVDTSCD